MGLRQRIAKNTLVILAGQVIILFLNLIVMVYLARYFGEEKYGMFSFAIAFTGIFAILANFGMKPIIIREISGNSSRARAILGTSILVKMVLAILSILLAIITAMLLGYSQEQRALIAVIAITIIVSSKITTFRFIFEAVFESELRMEYPIVFRIIDSVLMFGFIILLISYHSSIQMVTVFYVLSSIPGFLLTIILSTRYLKPGFQNILQTVRWLLHESWPLACYVGLTTVYTSGDVFLLKTLKNDAAVGYYSAAYRLIYPLTFIPAAIVMSLFPIMSQYYKDSREKLVSLFHFGMKIILLTGLGLALVTSFTYQRITLLLYSEQYLQSALPLMLLMWAEVFLFLNFFLTDFLTSVHQQRKNMYAIISMFIVNIVANVFFIPRWGINGASFIKIVSNMLGFSLMFYYASRVVEVNVLPTIKKIVPIAMGFSIWLFIMSKFSFLFVMLSSPVILVFLVLVFRFFDAREMKVFKNLLPGAS